MHIEKMRRLVAYRSQSNRSHRREGIMSVAETFTEVADYTARASGRPIVFGLVAASTAVWLLAGPVFAFSDTWQLIANTSTNIITFLMVFMIQNSQNRDTAAIH